MADFIAVEEVQEYIDEHLNTDKTKPLDTLIKEQSTEIANKIKIKRCGMLNALIGIGSTTTIVSIANLNGTGTATLQFASYGIEITVKIDGISVYKNFPSGEEKNFTRTTNGFSFILTSDLTRLHEFPINFKFNSSIELSFRRNYSESKGSYTLSYEYEN